MKRFAALALLLCLLLAVPAQGAALTVNAQSYVLMEKETGQVLAAANEHEQLEPASVTKVMTILLVMEAIDSGRLRYDDVVTASAYAASMGGSQVYLKENEQMTVEDLLKAVCVASGNDAAVALGEHIGGSMDNFVSMMNQRAAELGMEDTHFVNCTGLPAEGHLTSAYDIALMSRELILHHPDIRTFTTIWMDTLRDGAFTLANTNRLVRYYEGTTGLKTGSTDAAGYCLSATAERDGMELIAVVLKSPTSNDRFEGAKAMLNYGFASYQVVHAAPEQVLPPVAVTMGERPSVQPVLGEGSTLLLEKGTQLEQEITLETQVPAPVEQGQQLGTLRLTAGENVVAEIPLVAGESVARLGYGQILERMLRMSFLLEPFES